MTSPNLDPQVRLLAGQIATLQKRIFQLERNQRASAGPASIAAGGLTVTDPGGVPQVVVGQQSDGSYGVQSVTPQVPVAPDQPLAGPGILGIWVYWDGQMSDGSNPLLDLNSVQVHCSALSGFTPSTATLQGVLTGPGLFGVGNLTAGTTYYACFVAVNQAGNASPASDFAQATAQSVPAGIPAGSISGLQIQTGTLTAAQLAAEAGILGSQIAQNTITDGNIQAGTITANSIASNVITASLIEAGTIDAGLLAAGIIYAGIVNGTTITGAQLVGDGTGLELVLYNGTPAAGNMVLSNSSVATVDGHGNQVPAGLTCYTGDQAVQVSEAAEIAWLQNSSGQSGTWTASLIAEIGSGFNSATALQVSAGIFATAFLDTEAGVRMLGSTSPTAVSTVGQIWADTATTNAVLSGTLGQGMTGKIPIVQTDISSHSVGNSATATDVTKTWTIPANDASFASNSGTVYELDTCVDIVSGATSSEILTVSLDLDSSLTTIAKLAGGFNASATGVTYRMPVKLTLILTSTSTAHAILQGTIGLDVGSGLGTASGTDSANLSGHQAGLSFAIGSSHTIALNVNWAAAGGTGQFAGTNYSILTRKGP